MSPSQSAATITRHRSRLKWSKRRLARESGLSAPYISQMENGDRPVTPRALARVADAVRLHPYKLFGEAGFIPADHVEEAERIATLGMQDPEIAAKARAGDTGGKFAWLVADYLTLLGDDPYGTYLPEVPRCVMIDWSGLAPDRWQAMGQVNVRTWEDFTREAHEWIVAHQSEPDSIEGWDELTDSERKLLQQMANQLRRARKEGGNGDQA